MAAFGLDDDLDLGNLKLDDVLADVPDPDEEEKRPVEEEKHPVDDLIQLESEAPPAPKPR